MTAANEPSDSYVIESREHLLATLAEAAELEHALMCCYLYAMFSLKRSVSEGVSEQELEAISRWRSTIRGVALEEMSHLTLVANVTSALGGLPHFMRLNFPIPRGPFPADLVVELAPFDLPALEHFVYVERPQHVQLADGASFRHEDYHRVSVSNRLMSFAGDYPTVGALYNTIRDAVVRLCGELGEAKLFCGQPHLQVGIQDIPLPGLVEVTSRDSAVRALDTIVHQGEGAREASGSHFERFRSIESEYRELLAKNPSFQPARPAARNPVMRSPPSPEGKVWVQHPQASRWMDLCNAVYLLMLRVLVQVYSQEERDPACKKHLLNASVALMRGLTPLAEALTYLPAADQTPGVNAGMSFAMSRGLTPYEISTERAILLERVAEVRKVFEELRGEAPARVDAAATALAQTAAALERLPRPASAAVPAAQTSDAAETQQSPDPVEAAAEEPAPEPGPVEIARGKQLTVYFEAKRCIHARHCVTESPHVFLGGVEGEWIFPDRADTEDLTTTLRKCPSGALRYERHDGGLAEPAPRVNLLRLRENGPYALLANVSLAGGPDGYRMVLCRCGKSRNKPFCDNSHKAAGFQATGEPAPSSLEPLAQRDGVLRVTPTENGPLQIDGNLELCGGSGQPIARVTSARLCRCGGSSTKPFCDGTHAVNGFKARGASA